MKYFIEIVMFHYELHYVFISYKIKIKKINFKKLNVLCLLFLIICIKCNIL